MVKNSKNYAAIGTRVLIWIFGASHVFATLNGLFGSLRSTQIG